MQMCCAGGYGSGSGYNQAIAAVGLGLVQRLVSTLDDAVRCVALSPRGQACGQSNGHLRVDVAYAGAGKVDTQAFEYLSNIAVLAFGEKHDELLSTIARHHVGTTQFTQGHVGELAQHEIPNLVTVHVVDVLEMVQVDQGDVQVVPSTLGACQLLIKTGKKVATIEQARKFVANGNFLEPCHGGMQLFVDIGQALLIVTQCLSLLTEALLQVIDVAADIHEPGKAETEHKPEAETDAENLRLWLRHPFVGDQAGIAGKNKQRHDEHAWPRQCKYAERHDHEIDRLHGTANVTGVVQDEGHGAGGDDHLRNRQA